jgi:ABC-type lipoprotein export system ATPase subunit
MIHLRNVTKEFVAEGDDVFAVRDVSIEVADGEFLAIMGRSGSGKSTLLNVIAGLERPTNGTVEVAGRALNDMSDTELTRFRRDEVGVVFQFFNLLPTLSVAENIALPARLAGDTRSLDSRVAALIAGVGLEHRSDFRPHRLSGGELQRAAIARALVNSPRLLLADEPTGNLDTAAADRVMRDLRRIADDEGVTIVLVTHSPESAGWADRTAWMQDGALMDSRP